MPAVMTHQERLSQEECLGPSVLPTGAERRIGAIIPCRHCLETGHWSAVVLYEVLAGRYTMACPVSASIKLAIL